MLIWKKRIVQILCPAAWGTTVLSYSGVGCAAWGDFGKANRHLDLVRFQWNFHKFVAGKNKGRSPLELSVFQSDGRNWIEALGYKIPVF